MVTLNPLGIIFGLQTLGSINITNGVVLYLCRPISYFFRGGGRSGGRGGGRSGGRGGGRGGGRAAATAAAAARPRRGPPSQKPPRVPHS